MKQSKTNDAHAVAKGLHNVSKDDDSKELHETPKIWTASDIWKNRDNKFSTERFIPLSEVEKLRDRLDSLQTKGMFKFGIINIDVVKKEFNSILRGK